MGANRLINQSQLDMVYDDYGEVVNGEDTYSDIAGTLRAMGRPVLVGWTDEKGTHYDILFTLSVSFAGTNIQGGIRSEDLFVSIMRKGAFAFEIDFKEIHPSYYAEKLAIDSRVTAEKLAELINNVRELL